MALVFTQEPQDIVVGYDRLSLARMGSEDTAIDQALHGRNSDFEEIRHCVEREHIGQLFHDVARLQLLLAPVIPVRDSEILQWPSRMICNLKIPNSTKRTRVQGTMYDI